ncbi:MAG: hypothetical protein UZ22_OP11002000685 [Microgenomates bacterium OLB23]|nr:MAG: hypothetical protein UZ22_OP11002000685 [Microgenomates bacterium OLB23]
MKSLIKLLSKIEKRRRFIIATFSSTAVLLLSSFFSFQEIYLFVPAILAVVYLTTFFAILEDISEHEWLMLFLHPIYLSVVFYLFYFFLPQRWLTRLPFIVIYTISMYAVLLSQNIFNVGVTKSLQLFRAAYSVNFLFLTVSAFLAYSLIISLRMYFFLNFLFIFIATMPLVMHLLWSIEPAARVSAHIVRHSILIAIIIAEAGMMLSFIPLNQSIYALILTSLYYGLCGLFQVYLQGSLFKERVREYIFVFVFTLIIFILGTRW